MKIKTILLTLTLLTLTACQTPIQSQNTQPTLRQRMEQKFANTLNYQDQVFDFYKEIELSPTTKIIWYDWQTKWWGSFNVVETDSNGNPIYWYDIPQKPTAQSINSIRVITLAGQKFIEVIDYTHMGNGHWYLYKINNGSLKKLYSARVYKNGNTIFKPKRANINYQDLGKNTQGRPKFNITINAKVINKETKKQTDHYHREFQYTKGLIKENKNAQKGSKHLMD